MPQMQRYFCAKAATVRFGNVSIYRLYREIRSYIVVLQTFSQVNNIAYVIYRRVYKINDDTETNIFLFNDQVSSFLL